MKRILFVALFVSLLVLSSCNVTRIVSTEARSYQVGDTCVYITTRTVETYDASKK